MPDCDVKNSVGDAADGREFFERVRYFFLAPIFFKANIDIFPSNYHVFIVLCSDVGGRLHWRDTRAAAPTAFSRLLWYCQNPRVPPPQPAGRGSNITQYWTTETPHY